MSKKETRWKRLSLFVLLAAPLILPLKSSAASIYGTSINVTSVFNGRPAQQFDFANITATRINAGVFSDWMIGGDTGTNFEFIPGTDNGDRKTRNVFDLNFSGNELYNNFQPTDLLTLTLTLDPGLSFNTNYMAITIAKDTQVPGSSVNGGTLTLDIAGLDQLAGNGGQLEIVFDVETPEPSTLLLGLPALMGLFLTLRRRGA
jgi:hypothetical protein